MAIAGKVAVLGAGGHAKVVIAAAEAAGWRIDGVYDDDSTRRGQRILGHRIVGAVEDFPGGPAVLAIGDGGARRALASRIQGGWVSLIHPGAVVHPSVRVGPGAVVFAGAVVQPESVVGAHAIINTAASVDHDCQLGDFAHIGPGVHLCGGVTIGDGSLLGVGSCAVPGITIGSDVIVGAGAVVVRDVLDGVTVRGVPARRADAEAT